MTDYVGETYQFATSAIGFDGETPLTDDDVTDVTIQIFDSAGTEVQAEVSMTYNNDDTDPEWTFDWDTSSESAGLFQAKIKYTGATFTSFEFQNINLLDPPAS